MYPKKGDELAKLNNYCASNKFLNSAIYNKMYVTVSILDPEPYSDPRYPLVFDVSDTDPSFFWSDPDPIPDPDF
jgi:hypothetical protein